MSPTSSRPSISPSDSPAWRLAHPAPLLYRVHLDGVVLFNRLSGDTHLITAGALQVLLFLQARPGQAAEAVLAALGADGAGALEDVQALLDELASLDLIESHSPDDRRVDAG